MENHLSVSGTRKGFPIERCRIVRQSRDDFAIYETQKMCLFAPLHERG
jgi:hypothetical protein